MMKLLFKILFVIIAIFSWSSCEKTDHLDDTKTDPNDTTVVAPDMLCNGYNTLCGKLYNDVLYVTTNNSFNYEEGPQEFSNPSQQYAITNQLKDGVRALTMDIHINSSSQNEQLIVFSESSSNGTESLANVFNEIRYFLDNNPNEVITLIVNPFVNSDLIEFALIESMLMPFLHVQKPEGQWPTLNHMIVNNKRLVYFSLIDEAPVWNHYFWDFATATNNQVFQTSEFSCATVTGNNSNNLYMLNHFLIDKTNSTTSRTFAEQVNQNPYLLNRTLECLDATNKLPNFLVVDYYNIGSVFDVANILNEVNRRGSGGNDSTGVERLSNSIE